MEVKVKQMDRFKFNIGARSHSVISDQPTENRGEDVGMTPPELMLASLGACAEFYAVQYLRTRKLNDCGVEATVTAEKLMQPARLGNFRIHVTCPAELSAEQTEGLRRSVHHCLIHNNTVVLAEHRDRAGCGRGFIREFDSKMNCPAVAVAGHSSSRLRLLQ